NPRAAPPVADPQLVAAGERLARALAGAAAAGHRFEAPLRARVDAGGSRTGDAAGALRELAAREAELRRGAAEIGERAAGIDVERSLAELEKLRKELTETVERRFEETFAAVQRHFADVAETLFPGGEGRLRLSEPDEDGADDGTEPGVEIELRPAGKRVTKLSLLSGGEKALGAISFLFAPFLARPCPFYLLAEAEAALDDTTIGRFVELLRRYADEAQFIVITHQKRTM